MSKTDKTRPCWVRLREIGAEEYESTYRGRSTFSVPSDFRWSNRERGLGHKYVKWAKRYKSKANRRRPIPWEQMRGHGYGDENYRF